MARSNQSTAPQGDQRTRPVAGGDGVALWASRAGAAEAPTPWTMLALLGAAAVVLRAIGLNGGLWYDEIMTLLLSVRSPLYDIITEFPGNNQHTLFSVLAHLSVQIFGDHPWSLRLPSVVLGVATVPVLYFFAREFCGRLEALLACLLLATAYHHVWFSQNARGYSALAFLTVLASWLLLRVVRSARTTEAVWYGFAAALGVYAHLTMVFLVASHAILLAIAAMTWPAAAPLNAQRRRVAALAILLAGAFTILLYSPVLLDVKQFFVDKPAPETMATPRWAALELIRGLQIGLGAGLGALVAATFFIAGVWSYLRQSWLIAGLFLLPGLVTVGGAVALQRPIFPRFLFFLIGFGMLILIRGAFEIAGWFTRRRAAAGATVMVGAMAALSIYALIPNYRYPKQDFQGAMQYVDRERAHGELVATVGVAIPIYRDYYQRNWEPVRSLDDLNQLRDRAPRVWVLYTLEGYIEGSTPDLMAELRADCAPARVFRSTVGNGDVTVCALNR
jgi:4-amino-4-deoxy-L-arabinose transferase-like glycosyltransferase